MLKLNPRAIAWVGAVCCFLCATRAHARVLVGDAFVGGQARFVTIDPSTGTVTPLGAALPVDALYNVSTADASGNKFFTIGQSGSGSPRVLTIDISSGNVLADATLPSPPPNAFEFESSSGNIVGHSFVSSIARVVNVSANSGNVATVGSPLPIDGLYSAAAIDPVGRRYYMMGLSGSGPTRVLSVDTLSGTVVQDQVISASPPVAFEYDPTSGELVGHAILSGQIRFISLNPLTGAMSPLGSPITSVTGVSDVAAIDAANQRYFMAGVDNNNSWHILTLDSGNGNVITDALLSNTLVTLEIVPEPATVSLAIVGCCVSLRRRRR